MKFCKIIFISLLCVIITVTSVCTALRYNSFKNSIADGQIHFSIDDVIDIFLDLAKNQHQYDSIFDNSTLDFLRTCHMDYGAKFVLYCFYESDDFNLSMVPDKYRSEFLENSDWLNFGFHYINSEKPNEESAKHILSDYQKLTNELIRVTGSTNKILRLSYFMGNYDVINSLKKQGVKGFLTADDERLSYYLNEEESEFINNNDIYIDKDNGIKFISTDIRLEKVKDKKLYSELIDICLNEQQNQIIAVFTHEYALDENMQKKIKTVCEFANHLGYSFTMF